VSEVGYVEHLLFGEDCHFSLPLKIRTAGTFKVAANSSAIFGVSRAYPPFSRREMNACERGGSNKPANSVCVNRAATLASRIMATAPELFMHAHLLTVAEFLTGGFKGKWGRLILARN